MSKNTSYSGFRKIDVDQYSEDVFRDEEGNEVTSPGAGYIDEQEVMSQLRGGRAYEALRMVLIAAPVGSKNQSARDQALALALKVILSIKTAEIDSIVKKLDTDQVDILMKYIYRGFECPSDGSSAHLLAWHDKVYQQGGVGSIVRVLTDKKRV